VRAAAVLIPVAALVLLGGRDEGGAPAQVATGQQPIQAGTGRPPTSCPDLVVLPEHVRKATRAAATHITAPGTPTLPPGWRESIEESYETGGRPPGRYRALLLPDPDPNDDVIPCMTTDEWLGPPPSLPIPDTPRGR
jgi:hypothetical protein